MAVTRLLGQTVLVPDVEAARATYARLGLAVDAPEPQPGRGIRAGRAHLAGGTFLELAEPLDVRCQPAADAAHALVRRGQGMYTVHVEAGASGCATLHGTHLELVPAAQPEGGTELGAPAPETGTGTSSTSAAGSPRVAYRTVWNAAVAVHDIDPAVAAFEQALDMPVSHRQDQPSWGLRTAIFRMPGAGHLELVAPVDPTQDAARRVARTIEAAGEGPYMLVLEVDDVHAAHRALDGRGLSLIGPAPIPPGTGWVPEGDQLWVHPRDAGGVFLELISFPDQGATHPA
jgi:catechol 2,3-dioxygenase-like lactoylglutathione lyase family enzyme